MRIKLFLFLLAGLLIFSCKKAGKPEEKGKSGKQKVEVWLVEKPDKPYFLSFPAKAEPNERVELRAEVSGRVERILFEEGNRVVKDQLLIKINDDDLQAQVRKIAVQARQAQSEYRRKQLLAQADGVSVEELDRFRSAWEMLEADLQLLQSQLRKTEIRAPFAGIIGFRSVSPGAWLSPGTPVATIFDSNPLKVTSSLPEHLIGLVKPGSPVFLSSPLIKDSLELKVDRIEPGIDSRSQSFKIRLLWPNPPASVLPGSFVQIRINMLEAKESFFIPSQCIVPGIKEDKVWRIREGKAQSVAVVTGIRTGNEVEIRSGISQGDSIARSGLLILKEDMPVGPIKSGSQTKKGKP